MLCNTVAGGNVSDFPKKKCYEDVRFNVVSVMSGWEGGCQISMKKALGNR